MSSFWLDEPTEPLPQTRVDAPEVEIVGAGITGISAALTLAAAGRRVRVHDGRAVAGGASGRNGGFALRGGSLPYDQAREWLGPELARDYWRETERQLDRLAGLGGDALRRPGSLRIADDAEERDELRREHEALREDGFAAEWRDDLDGFAGAIFHPGDGAVQPARLVRRLAGFAAEQGVEIREQHRVVSLAELEAERVLVATDGYPSGLLGELEGLIVPTRGQMLVTEPVAERLFEPDCPHYGRHGFDYWQQLPDGRVTAGGFRDFALDSEFTDREETTQTIQQALEEFVARVAGRPLAIEQRWAGIFGLVLDFLPVVGPLPRDERTWVAGGYSGHGNVLGFLCGDLAARALLGDRADPLAPQLLAAFAPDRLLRT